MLDFLRSLFRKKPLPIPEPIVCGDVWELRGENDPWPRGKHAQAVILDYKQGWVRYALGTMWGDERMKESIFRHCYRKVPAITTTRKAPSPPNPLKGTGIKWNC